MAQGAGVELTHAQVISRLVISAKLLIAAVRADADRETLLAKVRDLEDAVWKIRLTQKEEMRVLIDNFCDLLDRPGEQ
jgi:hypothetical protein